MERDLTRGKPMSLILRFCLPLFAGNLFQQLYNLVDTIIVGQFVGKTALSAVGSVGSLSFMVIGTIIGLCSGFAIPVAQAFGAEDRPKMRRIMAHITYLAVGLGAVISVVTVMCTDLFLQAMNTPEDIYKDAHEYIIIIFAGTSAMLLPL